MRCDCAGDCDDNSDESDTYAGCPANHIDTCIAKMGAGKSRDIEYPYAGCPANHIDTCIAKMGAGKSRDIEYPYTGCPANHIDTCVAKWAPVSHVIYTEYHYAKVKH